MRRLAITMAVLTAARFNASANAQTVVTIGHSDPLTGPQAPNGKDNENGARLAIDEVNKSGVTVAGQKVTFKLDSEDDQADPKIGVQTAQKLVDSGVLLCSARTTPAWSFRHRACITLPAYLFCRLPPSSSDEARLQVDLPYRSER